MNPDTKPIVGASGYIYTGTKTLDGFLENINLL